MSAPDFNFIAPVYDFLARLVFGKAQQQAQAYFLMSIPVGAHVLILGGGSGLILQELLARASPAKVLYLEASAKMLALAQKKMQASLCTNLVEFRLGTEKDLLPHEKFDVILTPFVLDLFSEEALQPMLQKLDAALVPSGLWLHTDFYLSESKGKKVWQKPLLWAMYSFFRRLSGITARRLPVVKPLFQKFKYTPKQEAYFYGTFIKAQVLHKPSNKTVEAE